jgi:protein-glutamine gamma-glutamyltransferase
MLAAALAVALCWLTWSVRREAGPVRKEALVRAYSRLCAKLAAVGLPRLPHEGAEDYASRVAQRRPDIGLTVSTLCEDYSSLRYAAAPARTTIREFDAAVRAFRPTAAAKPPRG